MTEIRSCEERRGMRGLAVSAATRFRIARFAVLIMVALLPSLVPGEVARAQAEAIEQEVVKGYLREMKSIEPPDVEETPEIYGVPVPEQRSRRPVAPGASLDDSLTVMSGPPGPDSSGEKSAGIDDGATARGDSLKLFGFDFFKRGAGGFQELAEVPVPSDYRLGPGDKVIVNLWGRVDKTYNLTVDREGKVFFPEAGALVVWGQSMDQFREAAIQLLESVYSGFHVNVMMGRVRSIRVFVLGEAKQTGAYTVSSLSTFLNVLHQAGGPNERGSLRRLRLMRDGRIHETVDLYDMLLRGEGRTVHLQSNDAIFVPVIGPTVSVSGEVKRPAIYELVGDESVRDALELAGGLTAEGYAHQVHVERVTGTGERRMINVDLTLENSAGQPVADGDLVRVVPVDPSVDEVVKLSGWVKYPGKYGLAPGMRVSNLLRDGEVLRQDSYLPRAVIKRALPDGSYRLIPVNLNRILGKPDRYGALGETESAMVAGDTERLGAAPGGAGDRVEGSAEMPPYYGAGASADPDPVLHPRDELQISSARDVAWRHFVTIDGEVKRPGRYELTRGMRLSDLLFEAGGLQPEAYQGRAEVVRTIEAGRNQIIEVSLDELLRSGDPTADVALTKDDAVFVRRVPDRQRPEKVLIEGEVEFPGRYSLRYPGELLSEVLERCGGPTEHAFPQGAVFIRSSIMRDVERQGVSKVFMSFRVDSATGVPMQAAPWLDSLEPEFVASGRVAIDLPRLLKTGKRRYDVELRDGDRLVVPRRPSEVPVTGYVASSGAIQFEPGRSVGYYLDRAGGVTPGGDKKGVRVVRANGQVNKVKNRTGVELGDAILVPPRDASKGSPWRWVAETSTTIVGAAATIFILTRVQ